MGEEDPKEKFNAVLYVAQQLRFLNLNKSQDMLNISNNEDKIIENFDNISR